MLRIIALLVFSLLFSFPPESKASHGWLLYFEGSFNGSVVDASTGQPVEGAVVLAQYNIRLCGPLFVPECGTQPASFKETLTKKDGKFTIYPHVFAHPWPFTLGGEESYVVVYKPGYRLYRVLSEKLSKTNKIALEPVPQTYYPRKEEQEKATNISGIEWRETRIYKGAIDTEKRALESLERHPDGVIFHGLGEDRKLISPMDIAVDSNNIYVGDGGFPISIKYFTLDGDFVRDVKNWVYGTNSGGDVSIESMSDGKLWVTARDCLKEYGPLTTGPAFRYLHCQEDKFEFSHFSHRFKAGKNGLMYVVSTAGQYQAFEPGLYILDKDGNVIAKYKGLYLKDIAIDENGFSYAAFRDFDQKTDKNSIGVAKFNEKAELIKRVGLKEVYTEALNVAIDKSGNVYLAVNDEISVLDNELNFLESLNFKTPELGEVLIAGIEVDREGNYLYAIDSRYNRILKYDLKAKRLAPKVKRGSR